MSIASLSMYDSPSISSANNQIWQVVRSLFEKQSAQLKWPPDFPSPPSALNRSMPLADQWCHEDLFLSQTCGYPYVTQYRDNLSLLVTPRYQHPGCDGSDYSSFVVTARNASTKLQDYYDKTLAANSANSLSGLIALEMKLAQDNISAPFFDQCLFSGAHIESMKLVAAGQADLCCIDTVTWALACTSDPHLVEQLQTIAQTTLLPALPLVTSASKNHHFVNTLRQVLIESLETPEAQQPYSALGITGFDILSDNDYDRILDSYLRVPDELRGKIAKQ